MEFTQEQIAFLSNLFKDYSSSNFSITSFDDKVEVEVFADEKSTECYIFFRGGNVHKRKTEVVLSYF